MSDQFYDECKKNITDFNNCLVQQMKFSSRYEEIEGREDRISKEQTESI